MGKGGDGPANKGAVNVQSGSADQNTAKKEVYLQYFQISITNSAIPIKGVHRWSLLRCYKHAPPWWQRY